MKAAILPFAFFLVLLFSCKKFGGYSCIGQVVSSHDVPIPGVTVIFKTTIGGKSTNTNHYSVLTDQEGRFSLTAEFQRSESLSDVYVKCNSRDCDSGSYEGPNPVSGSKNFIIKLE
jgi:hypothetical protein